jgi:hypothetical protein
MYIYHTVWLYRCGRPLTQGPSRLPFKAGQPLHPAQCLPEGAERAERWICWCDEDGSWKIDANSSPLLPTRRISCARCILSFFQYNSFPSCWPFLIKLGGATLVAVAVRYVVPSAKLVEWYVDLALTTSLKLLVCPKGHVWFMKA